MPDASQQQPLAKLGVPPYETEYSAFTLNGTWPRGPGIEFSIAGFGFDSEQRSMRIPLAFIQGGGDNTWGFVHYLLSLMVNEEGRIVVLPDRTPVVLTTAPFACAIDFEAADGQPDLTWRKGPTGHRRVKAIVEGEALNESSRASRASEYSGSQTRFSNEVDKRDNICLLSGEDITTEDFQAAHIVPRNRSDVYDELGSKLGVNLNPYDIYAGILLEANLHKKFDQWRWSVYHKDGVYHIHVFSRPSNPKDPLNRFHGHTFSSTNFHPSKKQWQWPHPLLCEWHYTQCVLMRIRGFSSGLAVNAQ